MQEQQFDVTVANVYADISGSTALCEKVGNTQARAQIAACLDLLRSVIAEHGGKFIHSRGDDVLCTFENPANAFSTVKDMLAQTATGNLSVHIGVDYGPALQTSPTQKKPSALALFTIACQTANKPLCASLTPANCAAKPRQSASIGLPISTKP